MPTPPSGNGDSAATQPGLSLIGCCVAQFLLTVNGSTVNIVVPEESGA